MRELRLTLCDISRWIKRTRVQYHWKRADDAEALIEELKHRNPLEYTDPSLDRWSNTIAEALTNAEARLAWNVKQLERLGVKYRRIRSVS